jgi:hypothetical protein
VEDRVLTPHEDLRSASGLVDERARLDRRYSGAYNGHFLLAVCGLVGNLRGVPKQIRAEVLEMCWHALEVGERPVQTTTRRARMLSLFARVTSNSLPLLAMLVAKTFWISGTKSLAYLHSVRSEALHGAGFVVLQAEPPAPIGKRMAAFGYKNWSRGFQIDAHWHVTPEAHRFATYSVLDTTRPKVRCFRLGIGGGSRDFVYAFDYAAAGSYTPSFMLTDSFTQKHDEYVRLYDYAKTVPLLSPKCRTCVGYTTQLIHVFGLKTFSDTERFALAGSAAFNVESLVTPLPAAPPLYATGLGVIGLLAWRKRRRGARTA